MTLLDLKNGNILRTLAHAVDEAPAPFFIADGRYVLYTDNHGAVVLFDGTTADHFKGGRLTPDGLLMQGVTSKQLFSSCRVHLEFR